MGGFVSEPFLVYIVNKFTITNHCMTMKKKKTSGIAGTAFVGCMFVGMGLGYLFGATNAGMFIGMGVGFAFMAIIRWSAMEREQQENTDT